MKPMVPTEGAESIPAGPDWTPIAIGVAILLVALGYLVARSVMSAEFRTGLALGLGGLMGKELRTRSRGWRSMVLLTAYLGALTLGVAGFLALITRVGGVISPATGIQVFSALAVGSVLLLAFITPALTVGAVSGERERRTLDLLLVTRASTLGLVGGKLLGALFYTLFLLAASLPAFALVYLFGGVPPLYLGMALAVGAVTALAHASLGLLLSALLRRTIVASVMAYLVVLALVIGMPFVSAVLGLSRTISMGGPSQPQGPPPIYLSLSPLVSISSVMPSGSSTSGVPLVGDVMRLLLGASPYSSVSAVASSYSITRSSYPVLANPITGQMETATTWAAWVYHFLFGGAFSLLCLFLAALALAPVKPWRGWRFRSDE